MNIITVNRIRIQILNSDLPALLCAIVLEQRERQIWPYRPPSWLCPDTNYPHVIWRVVDMSPRIR